MVPHEPEKAGGIREEVVKGLSFNVSIWQKQNAGI